VFALDFLREGSPWPPSGSSVQLPIACNSSFDINIQFAIVGMHLLMRLYVAVWAASTGTPTCTSNPRKSSSNRALDIALRPMKEVDSVTSHSSAASKLMAGSRNVASASAMLR